MEPYFSPQGIFACFFSQKFIKDTHSSYLEQALKPEGIAFEQNNSAYGIVAVKTIQVHAYHRCSEGIHHLYLRVISLNEVSSTTQAFTLTGVHFELGGNSSAIKINKITQNLFNPSDDRSIESEEYDDPIKSSSYLPDMSGKPKREHHSFDLSNYKLKKDFETVFEGAEHLIPPTEDQPKGIVSKAASIVG